MLGGPPAGRRLSGAEQAGLERFGVTAQLSLFDPGRAPAGSHVFWVYAQVPQGWRGDIAGGRCDGLRLLMRPPAIPRRDRDGGSGGLRPHLKQQCHSS